MQQNDCDEKDERGQWASIPSKHEVAMWVPNFGVLFLSLCFLLQWIYFFNNMKSADSK